ncbi:hypothetical protein Q4498_03105 [Neptunomonas phycophila]|uniref:capsular polysaccharide export protein, LipB/KpsS family n=1 Tax=Neptunomonas phycophila TaxID=1572645 RepID=UPI0026E39AB3|nr:hypothetical protein [Neptunomonas phycophila]MDO6467092.1 hypothetical protein [Neptunomonas phycophila]
MGNNVLIQCGDHFENQNRILPLCLHLKSYGIRPIVLLYSNNSSNIFEYENIETINLDFYRSLGKDKIKYTYTAYDESFVADVSYIEKAKNPWKFSTKRKRDEVRKIYRDKISLEKIIHDFNIDIVGIWNGYTGYVANILRFYCSEKKIKCFFMERSFFKGGLFVDPLGANGYSELARLKKVESECKDIYTVSDNEFSVSDYIFIPLQVQTDTNNILFSNYVKSMRKLILLVYKAIQDYNYENSTNIKLVVREHPEEVDKRLNLPKISGIDYRNDLGLEYWIKKSLSVITINSTVGLEALALGKNVITLGDAIYTSKELTLEYSENTELKNLIFLSLKKSPDVSSVNTFLNLLYQRNTVTYDHFPSCLEFIIKNKNAKPFASLISNKKDGIISYLKSRRVVRVQVLFKKIPKLNLTYRNLAVLCDRDYIKSELIKLYGVEVDIEITRVNVFTDSDIYIIDSIDSNINIPENGFLLDPYLLPIG